MKILLPVDGSKTTRRMLSYIAAHDELLGAGHEYLLFTVVPRLTSRAAEFFDRIIEEKWLTANGVIGFFPANAIGDDIEVYADSERSEVLATLHNLRQQGWTLASAHAVGHAAEEIAAYAKARKPALIVMGTHGHSALGNAVLGSVTQGVLARCTVPMLLIH